jgi:uncharacterized phage protein (TIGR02218 family)
MSIFGKELTRIAFCWRLERRDGIALGFTSHDRDLFVGGLRYRAAPGMLPSSISQSDGFDVDSLDIEGALTSDSIAAADLAAGRWDGAKLAIFIADWEEPEALPVPIARGELGDISRKGGAFEAEMRGPTALLDRPVVEQTSPECRARLGDKRCRVDMARRARLTRIAALHGEQSIEVESADGGNAYAYGLLRWVTGSRSGLECAVLRSEGPVLTLRDVPDSLGSVGDLVEIAEGCDKSLATCSGRFANALNFRGEPHLPGLDLLTRYPGA